MPDDQKYFDVAHPGTTSPQHTSRPIITGQDQLARDPMMQPDEEKASGEPQPQAMLAHDEPKVAPINVVNQEKLPTEDPVASTEQPDPPSEPAGVKIAQQPQKEKNDEVVNQLVQNRSYELPIKQKKSSVSTLIVIILLIIVLVAGGMYALFAFTNVL